MTDDEMAMKIGRILAEWNPLGDAADTINDLNDYETEAFDILAAMEMFGLSIERAVKSVLEEAFLVELDPVELAEHCKQIKAALEM